MGCESVTGLHRRAMHRAAAERMAEQGVVGAANGRRASCD